MPGRSSSSGVDALLTRDRGWPMGALTDCKIIKALRFAPARDAEIAAGRGRFIRDFFDVPKDRQAPIRLAVQQELIN